jgi:S-DNA-T family DNA segregation ATPase FtsK/SpoIIIE
MREISSPTTVALGKDITGAPILAELMDMPHLLIAGATGSGKSVCINSIICSILYRASPRQVRLILIDPKFVELQPYNDVPHLLLPVISDAKKATMALDWVCQEMDERYQTMQKAGVRNLDAYNKKLGPDEEPLPRIVLVVDEMSDLMTTSGKIIEDHIKRITAKARAAGICLILATQRPSVNIITGVIKANIPGRIAFRVSSPFDSKTILDAQGAEKLLGYGDMLFRGNIREPVRVQGCFVSDRDVEQTVEYIKSRNKADYNLDIMEHIEKQDQTAGSSAGDDDGGGEEGFDELLPQAIEMAVEAGQMSISMLQRVLRVGYARAGRLIDEMDRRGIISGNEGTKARKTLMTREQYTMYLEQSEL